MSTNDLVFVIPRGPSTSSSTLNPLSASQSHHDAERIEDLRPNYIGTTSLIGQTIGIDFTVTFQLQGEQSYTYGTFLKSESVNFCGARWHLELFPVGFQEDSMMEGIEQRHAKLALHCSEFLHELDITNFKYETTLQHWYNEKASFTHRVDLQGAIGHVGKGTVRWSQLSNRYFFNESFGYCLSDGSLKYIVHLEATISDAHRSQKQKHKLSDSMRQYRITAAESADVVIVTAAGERLPAHRFILESRSDVFRAMLNGSMQEASRGEVRTTFSANVVQALLDFCYSDQCSAESMTNNVTELLSAANYYQVQGLVQYCEDFMCRSICTKNCSQYFLLAMENGLEELHLAALSFIEKNAPTLRQQIKRTRDLS